MAAAIQTAKKDLRKHLKSILSSMSARERQSESKAVVSKLLSSREYQNSRRVSVYLNMPEEVNTEAIVEDLFSSGRACFVPRYEGDRMEMLSVESLEDCRNLPLNKWNIRQPSSGEGREEALSSGGLDLLLVPGLGFSKEGHRLGRGKGYYDNYIARCIVAGYRPKLVALAFGCQMCEHIPVTPTDQLVDTVLNP